MAIVSVFLAVTANLGAARRSVYRRECMPAVRLDRKPVLGRCLDMADDAELVIAGGGLNGMLLAVACAGAGLSTIVIDRQDPAAMAADRFDGRSSAIAYGSRLVFDGIGLWPEIAGMAQQIREFRVADDNTPLSLQYKYLRLASNITIRHQFDY